MGGQGDKWSRGWSIFNHWDMLPNHFCSFNPKTGVQWHDVLKQLDKINPTFFFLQEHQMQWKLQVWWRKRFTFFYNVLISDGPQSVRWETWLGTFRAKSEASYFNIANLTFKLNQLVTPLGTSLEFALYVKTENGQPNQERTHSCNDTQNTYGTFRGPN